MCQWISNRQPKQSDALYWLWEILVHASFSLAVVSALLSIEFPAALTAIS